MDASVRMLDLRAPIAGEFPHGSKRMVSHYSNNKTRKKRKENRNATGSIIILYILAYHASIWPSSLLISHSSNVQNQVSTSSIEAELHTSHVKFYYRFLPFESICLNLGYCSNSAKFSPRKEFGPLLFIP